MATTLPTPSFLPADVRLMRLGANLLFVLATLGLLVGAGVWLAKSPWFTLRALRIEGDVQHNSPASIRAVALPQLQGNYLTLNLQAARAVFESVPWVRRAQVRRIWPDQLVVRLEEHRPVAFWERDDSDDLLVNERGEVFEVNVGDVEDEPMPTLRGPEGSAARVLAMWQRLAPEFEAAKGRLVYLALSQGGSWRARLENGAELEFGRGEPEELLQRSRRFLATVGQVRAKHENRAVESADLRHNEGYALRLAGLGTTDAPPGRRR